MSIYWYDFETFGADPFRDRPVQFAGIRTDDDLNIIGEPLVFFCKPADDCLPHPEACLVTGITPQQAHAEGVNEAEFCARIHAEFSQPNTCVAGYNSIRFDDEVTRNMLYRNFYDPYAREWQNGNSRWDIIDMVRLARAVRPEGVNWPNKDDGKPSFKLEQLTVANGIAHEAAHDALSDVIATIDMAKLIRKAQPRLYDFVFKNRGKRQAEALLHMQQRQPVLHISSKYPADKGCAAVVVPVARDPVNKNAVYVYDLSVDPEPLLSLDAESVQQRIFTSQADLPEGVERIPLKAVHLNKCPVLSPVKVLDQAASERLGIDLARCEQNLAQITQDKQLAQKVQAVFDDRDFEPATDPDQMIYSGGFFSDYDRGLMEQVREASPQQLAKLDLPFQDVRLPEMLFRYRARNFPETLSEPEHELWQAFRRQQIMGPDSSAGITYSEFEARIDELLSQNDLPENKRRVLEQLQDYGQSVVGEVG